MAVHRFRSVYPSGLCLLAICLAVAACIAGCAKSEDNPGEADTRGATSDSSSLSEKQEECPPVRGTWGPCDNPTATTPGCASSPGVPSIRVEYDGPKPFTRCRWLAWIYRECIPECDFACKRTITTKFEIGTDGYVDEVMVSEDSPYDEEVSRCVGEHVKKLRFHSSDTKVERASLRLLLNHSWLEGIYQEPCPEATRCVKGRTAPDRPESVPAVSDEAADSGAVAAPLGGDPDPDPPLRNLL